MTAVHFTNDVVDIRYVWANSIADVVARKGGDASDYALGDYPVGSIRDPATGIITPYTPSEPTNAEKAAQINLTSSEFMAAIQLEFGLTNQTPQEFLAQKIDESALDVTTKAIAKILIQTAAHFQRWDKNNLIETIGTGSLGMTTEDIDLMYIQYKGFFD